MPTCNTYSSIGGARESLLIHTNSYSRIAKSSYKLAKSFCKLAEPYCNLTKSFSKHAEPFYMVTKSFYKHAEPFYMVTKSFCKVDESFYMVTKSFCKLAEPFYKVTKSFYKVDESFCKLPAGASVCKQVRSFQLVPIIIRHLASIKRKRKRNKQKPTLKNSWLYLFNRSVIDTILLSRSKMCLMD